MAETKINHKNYFTDKEALSIPWVESPFFKKIMEFYGPEYTDDEWYLLTQFNELGYVKIDLELDDEYIRGLQNEIVSKLQSDNIVTQDKKYHYSDGPRVFEAWKDCKNVLDLSRHPKILQTLSLLYGKQPIPFQTINFTKGSNQPLHSDTLHFHTYPERWMAGVWVALEDMDEENGTLCYVPGSHKAHVYDFLDICINPPKFGEQFEAYAEYENFIRQLVSSVDGVIEPLICSKGTAIIWAANLLHGGLPVIDESRSRWAQAIHYYFPNCHYYSPMFSNKYM